MKHRLRKIPMPLFAHFCPGGGLYGALATPTMAGLRQRSPMA